MYSISDISRLTGITAYTLRYYEQKGILPNPRRQNGKKDGIREYDDQDLRFIRFIHGLKLTGMKLDDIVLFVEDGCLLTRVGEGAEDIQVPLRKRLDLLNGHIDRLNQQIKQLEKVKKITQEKKTIYLKMLEEKQAIEEKTTKSK